MATALDSAAAAHTAESPTLGAYLDALASGAPAPGGGSAAALAGALGAALVAMVARFTVGRPKYAAVEARVQDALAQVEALRATLQRLMADDEHAYTAVGAAWRLPRTTPEEKTARSRAIQAATLAAMQPPLAMVAACGQVLDLASVLAEDGNPALASDAAVAALLAEAALRSAAINVQVNLAQLRDKNVVAATETELHRRLDGTATLKEAIVATATRRMAGG